MSLRGINCFVFCFPNYAICCYSFGSQHFLISGCGNKFKMIQSEYESICLFAYLAPPLLCYWIRLAAGIFKDFVLTISRAILPFSIGRGYPTLIQSSMDNLMCVCIDYHHISCYIRARVRGLCTRAMICRYWFYVQYYEYFC